MDIKADSNIEKTIDVTTRDACFRHAERAVEAAVSGMVKALHPIRGVNDYEMWNALTKFKEHAAVQLTLKYEEHVRKVASEAARRAIGTELSMIPKEQEN